MWLITGSGGQLGKSLQQQLIEEGIDFVALSHANLDITDKSKVMAVLKEYPGSVVVNTAAWTAVDDAEDHFDKAIAVNATGVSHLAHAAEETLSRLIHVSTDYVFDGLSPVPYSVSSPANPSNAYGLTKRRGEEQILRSNLQNSTIVRTAWLYSEFGKNFVKTMVRMALKKSPVRVVNDQVGQPTNAHDLSKMIIEIGMMERPPSIVHGSNSGVATWYELAVEIFVALGRQRDLVTPVSSSEYPTKALRPKYSLLSHEDLDNWNLTQMPDWKSSLLRDLPLIVRHVKGESHE